MAREVTIDALDLAVAKARVTVAAQLSELLTHTSFGGSKNYLAARLRAVAEAEGSGDDRVLRAALMELALASGAWAASLDLGLPADARPRRRN